MKMKSVVPQTKRWNCMCKHRNS